MAEALARVVCSIALSPITLGDARYLSTAKLFLECDRVAVAFLRTSALVRKQSGSLLPHSKDDCFCNHREIKKMKSFDFNKDSSPIYAKRIDILIKSMTLRLGEI